MGTYWGDRAFYEAPFSRPPMEELAAVVANKLVVQNFLLIKRHSDEGFESDHLSRVDLQLVAESHRLHGRIIEPAGARHVAELVLARLKDLLNGSAEVEAGSSGEIARYWSFVLDEQPWYVTEIHHGEPPGSERLGVEAHVSPHVSDEYAQILEAQKSQNETDR